MAPVTSLAPQEMRITPVLLLAGSFEPFDEGKARSSGAEAWIEKPFESQSLIDRVAALLGAAAPAAPAAAPAVSVPVAPVSAVSEPVAQAPADPFADISFKEPAAAAVPAAAIAATADDWSDLIASPVTGAELPAVAEDAFAELPPAAPAFEFAAEPFAPAAEPLAFVEPTAFGEAEEVMALAAASR